MVASCIASAKARRAETWGAVEGGGATGKEL